MEDNYLWDRSGEPDPQIQELEQLLGTLRYIPKPLAIPAQIQPARRRSFVPALAAAAAIALLALMLGLWFGFNRRQASVLTAGSNPPVDRPLPTSAAPASSGNETTARVQVDSQRPVAVKQIAASARRQTRVQRAVIREPELTPVELAEKEQVLAALRLVSFKLNVAKSRTQGTPPANPIRNQHRIG